MRSDKPEQGNNSAEKSLATRKKNSLPGEAEGTDLKSCSSSNFSSPRTLASGAPRKTSQPIGGIDSTESESSSLLTSPRNDDSAASHRKGSETSKAQSAESEFHSLYASSGLPNSPATRRKSSQPGFDVSSSPRSPLSNYSSPRTDATKIAAQNFLTRSGENLVLTPEQKTQPIAIQSDSPPDSSPEGNSQGSSNNGSHISQRATAPSPYSPTNSPFPNPNGGGMQLPLVYSYDNSYSPPPVQETSDSSTFQKPLMADSEPALISTDLRSVQSASSNGSAPIYDNSAQQMYSLGRTTDESRNNFGFQHPRQPSLKHEEKEEINSALADAQVPSPRQQTVQEQPKPVAPPAISGGMETENAFIPNNNNNYSAPLNEVEILSSIQNGLIAKTDKNGKLEVIIINDGEKSKLNGLKYKEKDLNQALDALIKLSKKKKLCGCFISEDRYTKIEFYGQAFWEFFSIIYACVVSFIFLAFTTERDPNDTVKMIFDALFAFALNFPMSYNFSTGFFDNFTKISSLKGSGKVIYILSMCLGTPLAFFATFGAIPLSFQAVDDNKITGNAPLPLSIIFKIFFIYNTFSTRLPGIAKAINKSFVFLIQCGPDRTKYRALFQLYEHLRIYGPSLKIEEFHYDLRNRPSISKLAEDFYSGLRAKKNKPVPYLGGETALKGLDWLISLTAAWIAYDATKLWLSKSQNGLDTITSLIFNTKAGTNYPPLTWLAMLPNESLYLFWSMQFGRNLIDIITVPIIWGMYRVNNALPVFQGLLASGALVAVAGYVLGGGWRSGGGMASAEASAKAAGYGSVANTTFINNRILNWPTLPFEEVSDFLVGVIAGAILNGGSSMSGVIRKFFNTGTKPFEKFIKLFFQKWITIDPRGGINDFISLLENVINHRQYQEIMVEVDEEDSAEAHDRQMKVIDDARNLWIDAVKNGDYLVITDEDIERSSSSTSIQAQERTPATRDWGIVRFFRNMKNTCCGAPSADPEAESLLDNPYDGESDLTANEGATGLR